MSTPARTDPTSTIDRPGLILYPPMRDLSDEEDAAEAQRRITAFHLWMLARPTRVTTEDKEENSQGRKRAAARPRKLTAAH